MKGFQFSHKLVNLISISIMETLVRVLVGNKLVDLITVNLRPKQGDFLSLMLFNVVMEKVIREMNTDLKKV